MSDFTLHSFPSLTGLKWNCGTRKKGLCVYIVYMCVCMHGPPKQQNYIIMYLCIPVRGTCMYVRYLLTQDTKTKQGNVA